MKKISTYFKKDPNDLSKVIDEINDGNEWVEEYGIATRKFDGTACAIFDGILYKRYDARLFKKKKGKIIKFTKEQIQSKIPKGAIECQNPDTKSGHWPHWIKCIRGNPEDKYHFEAFDDLSDPKDNGTYELCGEKVQGNPEKIQGHKLIRHASTFIILRDFSFNAIKEYLKESDMEGIVFHHKDDFFEGRMCKIRKKDFGIKR